MIDNSKLYDSMINDPYTPSKRKNTNTNTSHSKRRLTYTNEETDTGRAIAMVQNEIMAEIEQERLWDEEMNQNENISHILISDDHDRVSGGDDYETLYSLFPPVPPESASQEQLQTIPTFIHEASTEKDCPVCLDEMNNTVAKCLPCGHCFHSNCIDKWLSVNAICPIDKNKVFK